MPPPKHLKKEKDRNAHETLGIELPPPPPRGKPQGGSLLKVWKHGVPPQPLHDFPLPCHDQLSGTHNERIKILCESIHSPEFIEKLNATNFFEIRAHYRAGEINEWLHLGEIYVYDQQRQRCTYTNALCSNGHAWITFDGRMVTGWHYCHGHAKTQGVPTFLLSLENYLMYMHLRMGLKLPPDIFAFDWSPETWG